MKVLCLGEPVLRLTPRLPLMLHQTDELFMSFVGSEVTVAKSLALQGDDVALASVVSSNTLGDRSLTELRRFGVDVSRVQRADRRLGVYYVERGGTVRPDKVLYDRDGTAMRDATRNDFDWDGLLNGVWSFYFSGVVASITPELGRVVEEALIASKGRGISTFCDLNFRRGMISPAAARDLWGRLLPYVDVVCGSDEDYVGIWEREGFDGDEDERASAADRLLTRNGIQSLAMNSRAVDAGGLLSVQGMLLSEEGLFRSQSRDVAPMEQSGCGDAFSASIVHGLLHRWDPQHTLDYAVAHAAYKATVEGELSWADEATIEQIVSGDARGSIIR